MLSSNALECRNRGTVQEDAVMTICWIGQLVLIAEVRSFDRGEDRAVLNLVGYALVCKTNTPPGNSCVVLSRNQLSSGSWIQKLLTRNSVTAPAARNFDQIIYRVHHACLLFIRSNSPTLAMYPRSSLDSVRRADFCNVFSNDPDRIEKQNRGWVGRRQASVHCLVIEDLTLEPFFLPQLPLA